MNAELEKEIEEFSKVINRAIDFLDYDNPTPDWAFSRLHRLFVEIQKHTTETSSINPVENFLWMALLGTTFMTPLTNDKEIFVARFKVQLENLLSNYKAFAREELTYAS
jgi:hypothetical protein